MNVDRWRGRKHKMMKKHIPRSTFQRNLLKHIPNNPNSILLKQQQQQQNYGLHFDLFKLEVKRLSWQNP